MFIIHTGLHRVSRCTLLPASTPNAISYGTHPTVQRNPPLNSKTFVKMPLVDVQASMHPHFLKNGRRLYQSSLSRLLTHYTGSFSSGSALADPGQFSHLQPGAAGTFICLTGPLVAR
ncbi:hypothetical protein SS1G_09402 [Sclerotinia sclerotiorum 1980 UF-70]|uniref:Uncharacterized protein n=1 Tax=Sclerotinia sclerotiorum (strain ATCC 18683 / 1980 / Ss-1) TaxID=665079 RepID=A7EVP3_SCLS1|nr:hypothetical protein SS1G_09402 [Sclerotinia sclerotiorum 1980 UF-70]EDN93535.1 hypothetical protein SS1G_09402 [Sclerotinia sclerotiorum 1980 UF-70]